MGEYEPDDSRNVTLNPATAPGEPPRTGPREGEARRRAQEHETVPQANNAQEVTGGKLPDPARAEDFDGDEA